MSDETGTTPRKSRGRSPSYPALDLEAAIQRVRQLWEQERQHPASVDTIVRHWGYKSLNGPASVTLAALKKFGLVEDEGTGTARRARVTDLAVDILENPSEKAQRQAIQRAALNPAIHRELWDKYGVTPPSDVNLRWELTRERGFTQTGAAEFIPEYRATVDFAQLANGGTAPPQAEGAHHDKSEGVGTPTVSSTPSAPTRRRPMSEGDAGTYTIPLMGGASVIVEGEFPISEQDWTQFLAVLNAMKPGLVGTRDDKPSGDLG